MRPPRSTIRLNCAFGFARRLFRFFPTAFLFSDMSEAAQKSGYSAYWDFSSWRTTA
jgi:hypothetical protein